MDENDNAWMAAMYDEGDAEPMLASPHDGLISEAGTYMVLTIGDATVRVPRPEYVASLERRLAQQERAIRRLESLVRGTRGFIRSQTSTIADLKRDLDRKVDLREMP